MEIWLAILRWKFPSKGSFARLNHTSPHESRNRAHMVVDTSLLTLGYPAASQLPATTRNSTTTTRPCSTAITACDQFPSLSAAAATKTASTNTKLAKEHGLQINCLQTAICGSGVDFIFTMLLFCSVAI